MGETVHVCVVHGCAIAFLMVVPMLTAGGWDAVEFFFTASVGVLLGWTGSSASAVYDGSVVDSWCCGYDLWAEAIVDRGATGS